MKVKDMMHVVADGKLVGMVTDWDITIRCVADNQDMSKVKAKDVMTSGVLYCRDNEDVQMVGMVSLGDVSHALPRDITGEVAKAVSAHHG